MKRLTLFLMFLTLAGLNINGQTTEFSYQGSLKDNATLANGNYDFEFALFDALAAGNQIGSTIPINNVSVANGIFSVKLDFGSVFPGANRFLEIRVRLAGQPGITTLTPRQLLNSAPYSVKSLDADNAANAATANNALNLGGIAANQYVVTTDPRMTDPRPPLAGSADYIQNTASPQASSNFNISGTGKASVFNATTQFNINGSRVLTAPVSSNIFVGVGAGNLTMTGAFNSFFGSSAGDSNTTGSNNAFFGQSAGQANTQGGSNSFFGETSGFLTSTGFGNSFFGASAGLNNTSGNDNVIVGRDAGLTNTTGSSNTIIGTNANVGGNNLTFATAIGSGATVSASNTIALGRAADTVQIPGGLNVAGTFSASGAGLTSLDASNITSGTLNNARLGVVPIANGGTGSATKNFVDLTTNQSVDGNKTFSGTLIANIIGAQQYNIGFGTRVLSAAGSNNLFVGGLSGSSNIGNSNAFVGALAGQLNTSGSRNSFLGSFAGSNNLDGSDNSFFGSSAGQSNTTGSNNTIIGRNANVGANNLTFASALGSFASVNANDTIVLGKVAGTYNSVVRPADNVVIPGTLNVGGVSGNGSVILPNNAVSAVEMFDEPGVASATNSPGVTLGLTNQTLISRDITAPASGFVLVIGTLQANAIHTTGTNSIVAFGVSDATGTLPINQDVGYQVPSAASSATYSTPVTVHGLFTVAAGTHAFFLIGNEVNGDITASDFQLTLLFLPTSYGTVTPTRSVTSGESTEVEDDRFPNRGPETKVTLKYDETERPLLEQLARQQAEINALKKLVCASHPQAEICRQK